MSEILDNEVRGEMIVVVEDDTFISTLLSRVLRDEGFRVTLAENLKRGLIAASTCKPDLILLDLGLPDGDGMELIQAFRTHSHIPIIVLSARTEDKMKILALDSGADDYLTKPFSADELLARVRVQLRRRATLGNDSVVESVTLGEVVYYPLKHTLVKNEEVIHLTKIEQKLLEVLLSSQGKVLTQSYLLNAVWGEGYLNRPHYLRIYINRLRQKIEPDPAMPQFLMTEIGVGYRIEVP